MNKISHSIKDLLMAQRAEFDGFRHRPYSSREKEKELETALGSPLIKVITGPRRAGKSRLIQKVLENTSVAYINFEDRELQQTASEELIGAVKDIYPNAKYWYLDEIQDLTNWESFLNKLYRRGINLVVTGSNAKLLSTELASALTGRHIAIELLPFSYGEFLMAKRLDRRWETFLSYLETGGFPEVVLASSIAPRDYLATLFDSIVLKDLVRRKKIRNPEYLYSTLTLLINNVATRTSARALSRALGLTPSSVTIEKYLQASNEAYLIETLSAFRTKTKERLQSERKPYAIDTGYITAQSVQILPWHGRLLENAIYLELRRRGHIQDLSLFYYRTEDGREIDFAVRNGPHTTELIQVSLDLTPQATREREIGALLAASRNNPDATLTIVSATESAKITSGDKRITIIPAHQFCL